MFTYSEAGQDEEEEPEAADLEDFEVKVSSNKINAALTEMARIKAEHPDDKIVVVSQFTSFLSVMQAELRGQGFTYVRLDGTMSHPDRAEVVKVFQGTGKNSPKVLLLSLKVILVYFRSTICMYGVNVLRGHRI